MVVILFGIAMAALLPVACSFWSWLVRSTAIHVGIVLAMKVAILLFILLAFDSPALYKFQKRNAGRTAVRAQYDVKGYGRIASLQYYHSSAVQHLKKLQNHPEAARYKVGDYFWKGIPVEKRNLHIIVLESFIDARRIHGVNYGVPSPLCPNLEKYLAKQGTFSRVLSPIYGGGTCQAEFELLTGLPALSLVENCEFLCLNGSQIDSFVNKLKVCGYRAVATIGASSRFFNSKNAYKSIGFDEVHFADDNSYFSKDPGGTYIFDGDLLNADASRLEQHWLKGGKGHPLVNYVLGIYGHCPIRKDLSEQRPDVIHVSRQPPEVNILANQFYYRTKAVAHFLDRLKKIDPDGVVLVISDHLPFPPASSITYDGDKRDNIGVLLDRFSPIDVSGKHYYEIPHVLWNLLRNNGDALQVDKYPQETLENLNCALMMEGMGMTRRGSECEPPHKTGTMARAGWP